MIDIFNLQKKFFDDDNTKSYEFRLNCLKILKCMVIDNIDVINEALYLDLNKSCIEGYMSEIGMVISEINNHIRHLKKWMKPKRVKTGLANFKAKSFIYNEPYGQTLIISPWNYPFLLTIGPLISSLAGGNTAIIKPSEIAINTERIIVSLIDKYFSKEVVSVITGDASVCQNLLKLPFDFIFYTGSTKVGKIVYQAAALNLTPCVLELGGKSPVIIDETAKLKLAVKRIVFGKMLNAGQTCVAPDYVLIHKSLKNDFIRCFKEELDKMFNDDNYPKIISNNHIDRLKNLLIGEDVILGGKFYNGKLEMTLVNGNVNSNLMKEEIFGPILPIIEFDCLDEVISFVKMRDKPLALYYFSSDKKRIKYVLKSLSFGGGCINDTIMHLASNNLPFGGVGASGIGSYHGYFGYETFTHAKSILNKSDCVDVPLRYPPYNKLKKYIIKLFLK